MNNAIGVVFPYRKNGVWMFDDADPNLNQEPFVSGVPEMMEHLVAGIVDAHKGFALYFSAKPFPGAQVRVDRVKPEYGGNWYSLIVDGEERLALPRPLPVLFGSAEDDLRPGRSHRAARTGKRMIDVTQTAPGNDR
jgi:hypothetical protein